MAQLVARFPCKEEVSGSIPDVSRFGCSLFLSHGVFLSSRDLYNLLIFLSAKNAQPSLFPFCM